MTRHSTIQRRGIRIRKTTGMSDGVRVYEYWARPRGGTLLHKLGQINRVGSEPVCKAVRSMRQRSQLGDFPTMRAAEDWIAECDTWGELETVEPRTEG